MAELKPKFIYLTPTFGNPSGGLLCLAPQKGVGAGGEVRDADRGR